MKTFIYLLIWNLFLVLSAIKHIQAQDKEQEVFMIVETMPQFEDGEGSLIKFVYKNLIYPSEITLEKLAGTSYLSCVIDTNGSVINPTVLKSCGNKTLDESAVTAFVSTSGKWNCGKQKGNKVQVQYVFPVKHEYKKNLEPYQVNYRNAVQKMSEEKYEESLHFFHEVLKDKPDDINSLYNIALISYKQGDTSAACNFWDKASIRGDKESLTLFEKVCEGKYFSMMNTKLKKQFFESTDNQQVDEYPRFKDLVGENMEIEVFKFISKNIKYPITAKESGLQGTTTLSFKLNKEGKFQDIKPIRSTHKCFTDECIRVLMLSEKEWKPARLNNKPVDYDMVLPFIFTLK